MGKIIKRIAVFLAILLVFPAILLAETAYVIDDFDDMDFAYDNAKVPAWFDFDGGKPTVLPVSKTVANKFSNQAGRYYLQVNDRTSKNDWYIGGIGRDVKKDASKYTAIQMLVYGKGKEGGKFAVQLYDDDNGNDKLEQDDTFVALKDDQWEYEQEITWNGWRLITIPFSEFKDKNPKVGDDIFNPDTEGGSAGLLRVQVIFLPTVKAGSVDFGLDDIRLIDEDSKATMLIDNFEDGSLQYDFEKKESWWTFGNLDLEVVPDKSGDPLSKYTGKGILKIKGNTSEWYVGGFGKYLAIDASPYKKLKMMIYGTGKDSGTLQIEMYDDDNNTKELEQDKNFNPRFDDKWVTKVPVTWEGWKMVTIPFYKFHDANKTIGDNIMNMDTKNGSGGLLHFQVIVNATKKVGAVDLAIDSIKLIP